jgi:hypothetical protein
VELQKPPTKGSTFLELLQTFKGDFEFIGVAELGGVI